MSILFGLLLARRFYCRSALSLSPGRTGGLLPRINAPIAKTASTDLEDAVIFYHTVSTLIRFVLPEMPFVMPPVTIILSPVSSPKVAIALFFAA